MLWDSVFLTLLMTIPKAEMSKKSIVLETSGQSKSTWSDSDGLEWLEILKGSSFVI